jgi:Mg-chelatase subunit ChlD/uncharacterized membrane protein
VLLAGLLAAAAFAFELRSGSTRRGAALRVLVVVLTALALARPWLVRGAVSPTIALVDDSASVDPDERRVRLDELRAEVPDLGLIGFGDDRRSPVADALDLGRRALPDGGRLVLLTDGRFTGAHPLAAAGRALDAGIRLDVVPLSSVGGLDASVVALTAPVAWRSGAQVPVSVALRASEPVSGTLRLAVDGETVWTQPVSIAAAYRTVAVHGSLPPADEEGAHRISAELSVDGDLEPRNDIGHATTHIAPGPSVLVVGDSGAAVGLVDSLSSSGARVTLSSADGLPGRLSALEPWDVLVLVDVSARQLGMDQLAAVEAFVGDLGRGLVMTGGRQSFLLGGWETTPLESLAPVRLEAPPRGERDTVALLLMIDRSASMGTTDSATGISKLDLAREAATLSVEVLHPGDVVAVVAYDDEARWIVPPTAVGAGRELAEVEAELAGLETGGGTRILRALEMGLPALAELDTPTRHAVLLSDGRDFNPDDANYDRVVRDARAAGTTLSTIAIGFDSDRDLLLRLARLGRGRYHSADDPGDLPRLTVEESEILRARAEQTGDFRVSMTEGREHSALSGVDVAGLPTLKGYLAMSRRDGADVALESPSGDPLLATWGYGLGRVAAWTSDVGEVWARDWSGDPSARSLWERLVAYVAPAPAAGPPGVSVTWDGLTARLEVSAVDEAGAPLNFADVTLVVTGAAGADLLPLLQSGPGRYSGSVTLPGPGGYPAAVTVSGTDGPDDAAPVALAADAGPELVPGKTASGVLTALAEAGGGEVALDVKDLTQAIAKRKETALWPALLILAAALWPLEVARVVGYRPRLPRQLRGKGDDRDRDA